MYLASMIFDTHNRVHNYLRISLTDNCNLRCSYCMPEEDYDFTPQHRLMQVDEIENIAKIFVSQGVNKIRLTGGEPLVRKDAQEIIERLSKLGTKLTMTTNGIRINDFIDQFERIGLKSLNVSLDTLDKDKFILLTKRNYFERVYENIQLLLSRNFHVKINVVVMKNVNDNEIIDFVKWTKDSPVHVRFIEFMPFSGNKWENEQVFAWQEILDRVSDTYNIIPLDREKHETVKKYRIDGHAGTFAVISTMSSPFCSDCNRMRLTADGKMKNCLFSSGETDILTPFRNGEDILPLIYHNVHIKEKELGGQFTSNGEKVDASTIDNRSMITIGG
jgi:GTP 3',8-cyclase